jgi:hypothetical protein
MILIPTWLEDIKQAVLDHSCGGNKPLSDHDRGIVHDELAKHTLDINEVTSSPVLTREDFFQLFVRSLAGYAASVNSDILLPDANYLYDEFRPTQYESKLVYRALRYERKSDFPPTLENIRNALVKARNQTNCFALALTNIYRMMNGQLMLPFVSSADAPMPELTYEPPPQLLQYQPEETSYETDD